MNPIHLPAAIYWPTLTMHQKATLPRLAREQFGADVAPLRPAYRVTWSDIITYCTKTGDVDWLLRGRWQHFANTQLNIYSILFIEVEQFRAYVLSLLRSRGVVPVYIDIERIRLVNFLQKGFYNLTFSSGAYKMDNHIRDQIAFIDKTNTILPNAWGSSGRTHVLETVDPHDPTKSVIGYLESHGDPSIDEIDQRYPK